MEVGVYITMVIVMLLLVMSSDGDDVLKEDGSSGSVLSASQ